MPIPKRKSGEEAQDFMGRCMTSSVMKSEYPDQSQRVAICTRQSRAEANVFNLSQMVQEELVYSDWREQKTGGLDNEHEYEVGSSSVGKQSNVKKNTD